MVVNLHIDLETLQLIQGPGLRSAISSLRFKRGDAARLRVVFLESGITPVTIGNPTGLEIQIGIKPRNQFDHSYLAHSADWSMPAEGDDTPTYECELSLNTQQLNTALNVGSATDDELPEITLMGEITWREGNGEPTSTRTFLVVVENDVNRGTEGAPTNANPGNITLTGTIAASNLSGTNTGDNSPNSSSATAAQGVLAASALQPVAVDYRGAYNNGDDTYAIGSVVLYNELLYVKISNAGNPGYPPGGADWELFEPEIGSPAYDLWVQTSLASSGNALQLRTVANRFSADHTGWKVGDLVRQTDASSRTATITVPDGIPPGNYAMRFYDEVGNLADMAFSAVNAEDLAYGIAYQLSNALGATVSVSYSANVVTIASATPGALPTTGGLNSDGAWVFIDYVPSGATMVITQEGVDAVARAATMTVPSDLVAGYYGGRFIDENLNYAQIAGNFSDATQLATQLAANISNQTNVGAYATDNTLLLTSYNSGELSQSWQFLDYVNSQSIMGVMQEGADAVARIQTITVPTTFSAGTYEGSFHDDGSGVAFFSVVCAADAYGAMVEAIANAINKEAGFLATATYAGNVVTITRTVPGHTTSGGFDNDGHWYLDDDSGLGMTLDAPMQEGADALPRIAKIAIPTDLPASDFYELTFIDEAGNQNYVSGAMNGYASLAASLETVLNNYHPTIFASVLDNVVTITANYPGVLAQPWQLLEPQPIGIILDAPTQEGVNGLPRLATISVPADLPAGYYSLTFSNEFGSQAFIYYQYYANSDNLAYDIAYYINNSGLNINAYQAGNYIDLESIYPGVLLYPWLLTESTSSGSVFTVTLEGADPGRFIVADLQSLEQDSGYEQLGQDLTALETDVETAQNTADNAQSAASNAQSEANTAQYVANTALAAASNAAQLNGSNTWSGYNSFSVAPVSTAALGPGGSQLLSRTNLLDLLASMNQQTLQLHRPAFSNSGTAGAAAAYSSDGTSWWVLSAGTAASGWARAMLERGTMYPASTYDNLRLSGNFSILGTLNLGEYNGIATHSWFVRVVLGDVATGTPRLADQDPGLANSIGLDIRRTASNNQPFQYRLFCVNSSGVLVAGEWTTWIANSGYSNQVPFSFRIHNNASNETRLFVTPDTYSFRMIAHPLPTTVSQTVTATKSDMAAGRVGVQVLMVNPSSGGVPASKYVYGRNFQIIQH